MSKSRIVCLCSALLMANAGISDINIGPFFERDPERDFTAVRPFWSSTPTTEDFAWPLGTWHTNESQFWYRFLFVVYGHEKSFNLFPFWFSETDRKNDDFHWALFPVYGSHPHMLFMNIWGWNIWGWTFGNV